MFLNFGTERVSGGIAVREYLRSDESAVCFVHVTSLYPGNGRWKRNNECDMKIVRVSGLAVLELVIEGKPVVVKLAALGENGTPAYHIPKQVWYRWLILPGDWLAFLSAETPPWTIEQHEERDDLP